MGQVEELRSVLEENATLPVTLIGFSWGATKSVVLPVFMSNRQMAFACL